MPQPRVELSPRGVVRATGEHDLWVGGSLYGGQAVMLGAGEHTVQLDFLWDGLTSGEPLVTLEWRKVETPELTYALLNAAHQSGNVWVDVRALATPEKNTSGQSPNNRLANTKERDFSIGLDNHGFRYYDPEVGRYLTRDPISYASGTANLYSYVSNNPINHIDPLGLKTSKSQEPEDEEEPKPKPRFDDQGQRIVRNLKLQVGDVVGRSGTSPESGMIERVTGGRVSHVGIVTAVDKETGAVTITHSYPQATQEAHAVVEVDARDFFSGANHVERREQVARPQDRELGEKAAMEAASMAKSEHIQFDPQFNPSDNRLSCAEFVNEAYRRAGNPLLQPSQYTDISLAKSRAGRSFWGGVAAELDRQRAARTPNKVVSPQGVLDAEALRRVR